jgi:hypothetical protein
VALLALIAGTVSYLHMHTLVELHGQPRWEAALTPFSVDGMIVAASTTLLADARADSCELNAQGQPQTGFWPSSIVAGRPWTGYITVNSRARRST